MMKTKLQPRTSRNRKKSAVPLSKLRTSEVVRTVVDHPRRLEELVTLLQDKDRAVRGRAAATLARLSESHPSRLVRHLERLSASLEDDSAYVRWHLAYTLGRVSAGFPGRASSVLADLSSRLKDEDKVVRRFACRALESVATRKPELIKDLFTDRKAEMPQSLARMLVDSTP